MRKGGTFKGLDMGMNWPSASPQKDWRASKACLLSCSRSGWRATLIGSHREKQEVLAWEKEGWQEEPYKPHPLGRARSKHQRLLAHIPDASQLPTPFSSAVGSHLQQTHSYLLGSCAPVRTTINSLKWWEFQLPLLFRQVLGVREFPIMSTRLKQRDGCVYLISHKRTIKLWLDITT